MFDCEAYETEFQSWRGRWDKVLIETRVTPKAAFWGVVSNPVELKWEWELWKATGEAVGRRVELWCKVWGHEPHWDVQLYRRRMGITETHTITGRVEIWTDGSMIMHENERYAGGGVWIPVEGIEKRLVIPDAQSTQRAELFSLNWALQWLLAQSKYQSGAIRTDSMYALGIFQKAELLSKSSKIVRCNKDLVESTVDLKWRLYEAGKTVEVRWVKGHAEDEGNEHADKLAGEAARERVKRKKGEVIGGIELAEERMKERNDRREVEEIEEIGPTEVERGERMEMGWQKQRITDQSSSVTTCKRKWTDEWEGTNACKRNRFMQSKRFEGGTQWWKAWSSGGANHAGRSLEQIGRAHV